MVEKNKVVTLDYAVTDDAGRVLFDSTGQQRLKYLHGGQRVVQGLQKAVDGKNPGDSFSAVVAPMDGFGAHNPRLVYTALVANAGGVNGIESGMSFIARDGQGTFNVTILEVHGDPVTAGANPAPGRKALKITGTVRNVRAATPEEIATGIVRTLPL